MASPSSDPSYETLSENLQRLDAIRLSDSGLYTVALHAFIESTAQRYVGATREMHFYEIMQTWFQDHRESFPGLLRPLQPAAPSSAEFSQDRAFLAAINPEDELDSILQAVIREHKITNKVRHNFARLSKEEARGATWNFLRLGTYTDWSALPAAEGLRSSLDCWKKRETAGTDEELANLRIELNDLQSRSAELLSQRPSLEDKEKEIITLKQTIYTTGASGNESAAAKTRQAINTLRQEIDSSDYRRYLEGLSRFTGTARTRRDYEKHIVRLTPEQHETLADFSTERNMLITGGAGTGKTLVLLEALAHTLAEQQAQLTAGPKETTLVTFTKTLVKYDRYLAALMAPERIHEANLESSETFFWKKLIQKEPKHIVDYGLLRKLASELNTTEFFSDAELYIEIEEFLFGLNITREEYLDAAVSRKGLKTSLNLREREAVWAIRKKAEDIMLSRNTYSKHFARIRLFGWLTHEDTGLRTHEHLFVDESQDMSAVELMCLKELAGKSLIMAGDTGQSIYGFINPYRRANLELGQNQIRLLKTNHRNTIPIHNMTESFRRAGLGPSEDPGPVSYPFREGPDPEIHQMDNPDALADLLAAKARMYVSDLGYDAESVGILCSRTSHLKMMIEKLAAVGLESAVVKGTDFDFSRRGVIRLSTLHSSKGLDFPVVLMYVPELPPAREIDPPYQDRLYRNLQYVAMSRGMDVLERFQA